MADYTITYEKVTPESAAEGDSIERGYYMPGGWEYPIPDGLVGPAFTEWCNRMGPFDIPLETDEDTTRVEAAVLTLLEYGCSEWSGHGGTYYQVDSDTDYRTGEETRKAIHLAGFTDEEYDEIAYRMRPRS